MIGKFPILSRIFQDGFGLRSRSKKLAFKKAPNNACSNCLGSRRVFKQSLWLELGSGNAAFSRPAQPPVTQAVGRSSLIDEVNLMNDVDMISLENVLVGDADPEIVALEARIRDAQLSADLTALEKLIADDLLFTGPNGQLGTKAQDIEAYRSGIVQFKEHIPEELRIRRVGTDLAITSLRAQLAVDVAGNLSRGTYRYTRIWAREGGKTWRVVGGHVSLVD